LMSSAGKSSKPAAFPRGRRLMAARTSSTSIGDAFSLCAPVEAFFLNCLNTV